MLSNGRLLSLIIVILGSILCLANTSGFKSLFTAYHEAKDNYKIDKEKTPKLSYHRNNNDEIVTVLDGNDRKKSNHVDTSKSKLPPTRHKESKKDFEIGKEELEEHADHKHHYGEYVALVHGSKRKKIHLANRSRSKSLLTTYHEAKRDFETDRRDLPKHTDHKQHDGEYVTVVHGNKRKKIWRPKTPYPKFLDPSLTVISTKTLPLQRFMPTIGNGYLATVVHSDTIYRSDLFNGYKPSHRARIPSMCSVNITKISDSEIKDKTYSLDLGRAMYIEEYEGEYFSIVMKTYAHRAYKTLLVTELTIKAEENITIYLEADMGPPSDDLVVVQNQTEGQYISLLELQLSNPEYNSTKNDVFVFNTIVPPKITVEPFSTVSYLFLTSIGDNNGGTTYGFLEGEVGFIEGNLELLHVKAWEKEWKNGRIDLSGNPDLAKTTYASLYYLMSSMLPPDQYILSSVWPFVGLSPGDLAHGSKGKDYEGHVFWDQETWMYPPILMLQSSWAKIILNSRIRTLNAAKSIASRRGYKGAMFPWESAYTGFEVCPEDIYGKYEQHINGDIAFAVKQYFMMTNDTDFIVNGTGGELINDIASFWESRVYFNEHTSMYEIHDVMPPDEYHVHVNNSAYTNAIAQISLLMTKDILPLINISTSKYEEIGNKMYIPFNVTKKWHPEYDSYTEGEVVKQADVILLGFPLMLNMSEEVRKNDLLIYEKVTPGGPAMTWGMFAIGWLELGDWNKSKELFEKQLLNVNKPFGVWSELPSGHGAVNFITGMGGYLQSLIFGYGGFRIYSDRLEFDGQLPPDVTHFNISGLDYYHGSFDFHFGDKGMNITQTKQGRVDFDILLASSGVRYAFTIDNTLSFNRQKATICKQVK